jgi:hypothetical protein
MASSSAVVFRVLALSVVVFDFGMPPTDLLSTFFTHAHCPFALPIQP